MEKMELKKFWNRKKVLITGHTGFKGAWLVSMLNELGAIPLGYSLPAPSEPSLYEILEIKKSINEKIADIRSEKELSAFIDMTNPDIAIHMAAQPLVRKSYIDPIETFSTNVVGTAQVLNCLRLAKNLRSVVVVTTDKCYENNEWLWPYRENDRLGGKDPYSASKAATELVTKSYFHSFFENTQCGIATVRAGNVIGGGDFAEDRIIPDIIRSIKRREQLKLRNPKSIRPWQHVVEPLTGYLNVARKLYEDGHKYSQSFNFGPDRASCISVESLIVLMEKYLNRNISITKDSEGIFKESKMLALDNSKAGEVLSWYPKWTIELTIKKTCEWYDIYLSGADPREVTKKQIQEYFDL